MKRLAALLLGAAFAAASGVPAAAQSAGDQEAQMGAQVYQQLSRKGEIIARPSPLYDVLDPIATRIARVADPQYDYPFHFILVHEKSPNAFAVPGGNVYVTDSLMNFVKNQEELAGTLCHETSHDIHHDVVNLNAKSQTQGAIISILGGILGLGRSGIGQLGENLAYSMQTSRFSRGVESAADLKGADTCAQAGFNPYGLIWLFEAFQQSGSGGSMEILSDHPSDQHRIDALKEHLHENPALFGKFSPNVATATPIRHVSSQAAAPASDAQPPQDGAS